MNTAEQNKIAGVFYTQLQSMKTDWEEYVRNNIIIFEPELKRYNSLLQKASEQLCDPDILHYRESLEELNSSTKESYAFARGPLLNIKNLIFHLEGTYNFSKYQEVSFIKDQFLKDKYLLYLLDKKSNTSGDVLLSVTTEFETRLREKAKLPISCTTIDLANKALNPKDGVLILNWGIEKDREGFYNMVKGYFDFIRGKPHHERAVISRSVLYKRIVVTDCLFDEFNNLNPNPK